MQGIQKSKHARLFEGKCALLLWLLRSLLRCMHCTLSPALQLLLQIQCVLGVKKFWLRKSNLHIGGLVVRLLFLASAARARFPVKAVKKCIRFSSTDFSKCATCGARARDGTTGDQELYQLRQKYSWLKAKKFRLQHFRT